MQKCKVLKVARTSDTRAEARLVPHERRSATEHSRAQLMEKYGRFEKIGSGTYGTVYAAWDNKTGAQVAIKRMEMPGTPEGIPQTSLREIAVLKCARLPMHCHRCASLSAQCVSVASASVSSV